MSVPSSASRCDPGGATSPIRRSRADRARLRYSPVQRVVTRHAIRDCSHFYYKNLVI
ncbi:hypothetical protein LG3211_0235 [Lysobacter gummosus]|nr:hypothetical protein LG3211_0235 [Lysobacter gummosus]